VPPAQRGGATAEKQAQPGAAAQPEAKTEAEPLPEIYSWTSVTPVWKAPLKTFHNVTVVPPTENYGHPNVIPNGGPIFPAWSEQERFRYRLRGVAQDKRPPEPESARFEEGEFIWGCFARPHFGHLIEEHITRLLVTASQRPDLPILVIADPVRRPEGVCWSFRAICHYFGIPRVKVIVVKEPIRVARLIAAEVPEHSGGPRPPYGYLRLLEQNFQRNRIEPVKSRVLYVSRLGMLARFRGGNLGESYLAAQLEALGVTLLDPAASDLRSQLAHYAGAQALVFAEGSAMHGRQLLGKIDQRISVLNRRPNRRLAANALRARATRTDYVEATAEALPPLDTAGRPRPDAAISLYDLDALFAHFEELGVPLAAHWDSEAYRAACHAEAADWLAAMERHPFGGLDTQTTRRTLEERLARI
jgi:hypothetical protein